MISPRAMTRVCVPTKLVHVPTFVCILPFVLFVLSWKSNRLINQKRYSAYLHLTMGPQVCAVPVPTVDPSWVVHVRVPHLACSTKQFRPRSTQHQLLQPFHVMCKPIHSFVDSFVRCCRGCLQMNLSSLAQSLDLKYFGKFITGHSMG